MSDTLTVYFTSDTHGYLYPTNFCDDAPRPMGLLAMRFPKDENTLIIDGGDTVQGSPLTYFCRQTERALPVADAMNDRGYDYVTLGNHDFNYGVDFLRQHLDRLNAVCLCANVNDERGRLRASPAAVRVMGNGVRVALVGVVTDWVNVWEKPENLTGVAVTDPLAAARAAVAALPPHDVLIGIYHGGVERDLKTGRALSDTDENIACRLCEELPFDLLLTGHQHIAMAGERWRGTHIVQTPCNAAAYIKAEITVGERGVSVSSRLCDVPDRADLTAGERALYRDLLAWLDRPIGRLSRALLPGDKLTMAARGSSIADFFNTVQLWASGADLSCAALGNDIRGFDRDVTVRDVVASYVYANTLVVLRVTGDALRQALETCASYFAVDARGGVSVAEAFLRPKAAHYNYDYFSGVAYTFDLRKPVGARVTSLTRGGREILPDDRYTLCMCDYRATGAGGFACYLNCPREREINTEITELILNYLAARDVVDIAEPSAVTVIAPTGERLLPDVSRETTR